MIIRNMKIVLIVASVKTTTKSISYKEIPSNLRDDIFLIEIIIN
uniref:Uncharacterized protein n=1 Tax=Lepeophtheirus salmonis TaxID=72036 RepID=A0A0K2TNA1_LEPSM